MIFLFELGFIGRTHTSDVPASTSKIITTTWASISNTGNLDGGCKPYFKAEARAEFGRHQLENHTRYLLIGYAGRSYYMNIHRRGKKKSLHEFKAKGIFQN